MQTVLVGNVEVDIHLQRHLLREYQLQHCPLELFAFSFLYGLKNGAFVCIALGYESALEAVKDWIKKAS